MKQLDYLLSSLSYCNLAVNLCITICYKLTPGLSRILKIAFILGPGLWNRLLVQGSLCSNPVQIIKHAMTQKLPLGRESVSVAVGLQIFYLPLLVRLSLH